MAVHKPVRGRPSSVLRATWRNMSNQQRKRAKLDYLLKQACRITKSSDIRAYMVPVLIEPKPLCCHRPRAPRPHTGRKGEEQG